MVVVLLQSLLFLLQPLKQAPAVLPTPSSCGRLCDAAEASQPPTTPTTGQAIPLLTHTPCYSVAKAASHHSEPVNPRTPL